MQYAKFTFNPFQENTYILFDESKECVIIDPGCYYPNEFKELKSFVEDNGLWPVAIVNTHCHIDHMLGVQDCIDEWNLPFIGHEKEQLNLDRLEFQAQMFGLPLKATSPEFSRCLKEGDEYAFGNSTLKVLFVPGHSPGHLAFYSEKDKLLISGDVLFRGSIGRTDLPGCNHEDLISNIKDKVFQLPTETIVLAGHMENTSIGFEKETNPFFNA
jgi:glyoxylase-like metal-dependent hydrolase (beta-lactamase superfamily II)